MDTLNTLFLPELREMLEIGDAAGLSEFCSALHPARTAEFMEGLTVAEAWSVLQHAELPVQVEIFNYFGLEQRIGILKTQNINQVAALVGAMAADDRVDLLEELDDGEIENILQHLNVDERREFLRLRQYPEGSAGSVMTTEVVKFPETMTVREALDQLVHMAEEVELIYYLYVVDNDDRLKGVVSARQLLSSIKKPGLQMGDIMDRNVVTVNAMQDQEKVAERVARLDVLAIPVVDQQNRLLGIVTHDDIIDVFQEEAVEDAHRSAAVQPLDETYLRTPILTLSWKRGIWLGFLFFFALLTALALGHYETHFQQWVWLVPFIPLVISSGGNSGSQSATLIITALSRGHVTVADYFQIVCRELAMGLVLGGGLALLGLAVSLIMIPANAGTAGTWAAAVVPVTLLLVVIAGTLTGSILPLIFKRIGWDPALMSNPFVAGIIDIVGVVVYVNVAILFMGKAS
jgi:magnesium transporter